MGLLKNGLCSPNLYMISCRLQFFTNLHRLALKMLPLKEHHLFPNDNNRSHLVCYYLGLQQLLLSLRYWDFKWSCCTLCHNVTGWSLDWKLKNWFYHNNWVYLHYYSTKECLDLKMDSSNIIYFGINLG